LNEGPLPGFIRLQAVSPPSAKSAAPTSETAPVSLRSLGGGVSLQFVDPRRTDRLDNSAEFLDLAAQPGQLVFVDTEIF
jgi:hypothetical protein